MLSIFNTVMKLPVVVHVACAAATFAGFQFAKTKLDASYAASGHPVDYMTGQTGFNAEAVKGYYAQMQDAETLDVYWTTQLIDFGFIAAMVCLGLFFCTLVARAGRIDSWARRIGIIAGASLVGGAISDAIENGWSFVMLSNPADFAGWLAIVYSGFASLKFALITLGMLLVLISMLLTLAGRISGRARLG